MYCQYCHEPLDPEQNELHGGFCSVAHRELHAVVLRRRDSLSVESSRPAAPAANKTQDFADGCPICGASIPLLAKLRGARFCSSDHEEQYQRRGEAQILERLNWHAQGGAGSGAMISGRKPKLRRPPTRQAAMDSPAPGVPMPERPVQWTDLALGPPKLAPPQNQLSLDAGIGFTHRAAAPEPPPAPRRQGAPAPLPLAEYPEWTQTEAALASPPASSLTGSCAPRRRRQLPAGSAAQPAPQTARASEWIVRLEAQPGRPKGGDYRLEPAFPPRRLKQQAPRPHWHEAALPGAGMAATEQAWALAPAAAPSLPLLPALGLRLDSFPLHAISNWRPVRPEPLFHREDRLNAATSEWNESDALPPRLGAIARTSGGQEFGVAPRVERETGRTWGPAESALVPSQLAWTGPARPAALPGSIPQQASLGWLRQPPARGVACGYCARPARSMPVSSRQPAWMPGTAEVMPPPRASVAPAGSLTPVARKHEFEHRLPLVSTLPEAGRRLLTWSGWSNAQPAPTRGRPPAGVSPHSQPQRFGPAAIRPAGILRTGRDNSAPLVWRAGTASIAIPAGLIAQIDAETARPPRQHQTNSLPSRPAEPIEVRPSLNWSGTFHPASGVQFGASHPADPVPQRPPGRRSVLDARKPQRLEFGLTWNLLAAGWPAAGAALPTAGMPSPPAPAGFAIGRRTDPARAPRSTSPAQTKAPSADGAAFAFATPAIGSQTLTVLSAGSQSWTARIPAAQGTTTGPIPPQPIAGARGKPAWINAAQGGLLQALPQKAAAVPPSVGPAQRQLHQALPYTPLPVRTTSQPASYLAPQHPCQAPTSAPIASFSQGTLRRYPAEARSAFRPLALGTAGRPRPAFLVAVDPHAGSTTLAAPRLTPSTVAPGLSPRPPASLGRLVAAAQWSKKPPYAVRLKTPSTQILFGQPPRYPNRLKVVP